MTQLLVSKSPFVWKKLGGWGGGSEQAPVILLTAIDDSLSQQPWRWEPCDAIESL